MSSYGENLQKLTNNSDYSTTTTTSYEDNFNSNKTNNKTFNSTKYNMTGIIESYDSSKQIGIINAFPHHHEKINFKINNLDKSLTNNFSFKEIQIILPINQKINFTLHQKTGENNDTHTWPTDIKLINENKNKLENENLN